MGLTASNWRDADPRAFERIMVFVDGTNVFERLKAAGLRVPKLLPVIHFHIPAKKIIRAYLYTTELKLEEARGAHGGELTEGLRVVLGHGVVKADGNIKEKGVDALLVADLVYHAAAKNLDFAVVVSHDTDFALALKRVEDFGCRTAVFGVACDLPDRLREASDETFVISAAQLIKNQIAQKGSGK